MCRVYTNYVILMFYNKRMRICCCAKNYYFFCFCFFCNFDSRRKTLKSRRPLEEEEEEEDTGRWVFKVRSGSVIHASRKTPRRRYSCETDTPSRPCTDWFLFVCARIALTTLYVFIKTFDGHSDGEKRPPDIIIMFFFCDQNVTDPTRRFFKKYLVLSRATRNNLGLSQILCSSLIFIQKAPFFPRIKRCFLE